MAYSGWKLTKHSRDELLALFPPCFPDVLAHHITLNMTGNAPASAQVKLLGIAIDPRGLECLVVSVDGTEIRPDGKVFHITWSIDRSAGFKPVNSNNVIEKYGFVRFDEFCFDKYPLAIDVVPFWADETGEHEDDPSVKEAKDRCRADGYLDVNFIGTKGYPNWYDYTDEAIAKVRAFVKDQAQFSDPE